MVWYIMTLEIKILISSPRCEKKILLLLTAGCQFSVTGEKGKERRDGGVHISGKMW